ncbi:MAG: hypothetical protein PHO63_04115 [Bacilli bacterium]|nr:hypothetical protein [Bacilli bacterium]MDD4809154.1 hypothetical protein [Bacilli bacterium]
MKLYDNIKKYIKEYYKSLIICIIAAIVFSYQFPYLINTPGGIINISERVDIKEGYESQGSFNLAYVSERRATIPTLFISLFNKNWDVFKISDVTFDNQTLWEMEYRDHLLLREANNNAIMVAYQKLGKKVDIVDQDLIVSYIDSKAKTDIIVGDIILEIEGKKIDDFETLSKLVNRYEEGDIIDIKVQNNDEITTKKATLYYEDDRILIGIILVIDVTLETTPEISLEFKKSESGPSGGLMTAISIYDRLIKEDLTHGKRIVGTGTIDRNGSVGSIGGIKYKILGAVKEGAEIFITPNGSNYEEAMELKKENNYDIEIIGVSTFDEAIEYLKQLK